MLGMDAHGQKKPLHVSIAHRFREKKIGFQPYDLRHAYALRGFYRGFKVNQMAKYMGHSIIVHEKLYQKHLPDDQKLIDYRNTNENFKHQEKLRQNKLSYDDLEKQLLETTFKLELLEHSFTKSQEQIKQLEIEVVQLQAVNKVLENLQGRNNSSP